MVTTTLASASLLLLSLAAGQSTESYVSDQARDDTSEYAPRNILLKLFAATGGLEWTKSDDWFQHDAGDVCTWYGIECYDSDHADVRRRGHVRSIDLEENHLVGTLPGEIWQLPYLEEVSVKGNEHLDVDLSSPALAHANFLTRLGLSRTLVSSIDGVERASHLEVLHITDCDIETGIPDGLYSLTTLVSLFANDNDFKGTLSTLIGRLTDLEDWYMYDNSLTGTIPSHIGMLSNVQTIGLGLNDFQGTLPTEIENLSKLHTFAMQNDENSERDEGLSGPIPTFRNAENMELVDLSNQQFGGSIPADFLLNAPTERKVQADLSSNKLSGAVPTSLLGKKHLALYLADNAINSVDSSIFDTSTNSCPDIALWFGGAPASDCSRWLCPPDAWAPLGRATPSQPCMPCGESSAVWGRTRCEKAAAGADPKELAIHTQRQILVKLYNVMGGRGWKREGYWLDLSVDVCDWQNVGCDAGGRITTLDLSGNSLSGTPPKELFSLPELTELRLGNNPIDFSFEGIRSATKLEVLDLSHAGIKTSSLTHIDEIVTLGRLRVFSLESNDLDGPLPLALFSSALMNLESLSLAHNKFVGPVPTTVGKLLSIKVLDLSDNLLDGSLPAELGDLVGVTELMLSENRFTGTLPTRLESLTKLRKLTLHQRDFENGGITGPLLAFPNSPDIVLLQLESNELSGPLPADFLLAARKETQLVNVVLNDNNLQGPVPTDWVQFKNLYVELADNRITELSETLCTNRNWMGGDVGAFGCRGMLCPAGTFNDLGRQTSAEAPCRPCPANEYLGGTECGATGENVGDDSELDVLRKFFLSTNGHAWENQEGWTTSQDYCEEFHGVYCDGNGKVIGIDLTDNGLSGSPDASIFDLPNLAELDLSSNALQFSFEAIGKATNLRKLALGDTGLQSVLGIEKATSLIKLDLQQNSLKGPFPTELFSLTGLRQLSLNYNQISGHIPSDLSPFSEMEILELHHNALDGALPVGLGLLTSLLTLNLAENNFDSTIPEALNSLTNLRFLSVQREGGIDGVEDVGVNHNQGKSSALGGGLTGPLPAFDKLQHLRQAFFGFNSLSGTIPFNFLDGVNDKSEPISVDLTNNRINGTIPASLSQFDRMTFYAQGNRITGIADALCEKEDWFAGDEMETYKCDAVLCPADTYNEIGRETSEVTKCRPCESGTRGVMGSFVCLNREEHKTNSERGILETIYRGMGGEDWHKNTHWMDPDVSICEWYGVRCADGSESVLTLNLPENGLHGNFPSVVYQLTNLQELNLKGNDIVMDFFEINIAHTLHYLNLEETGLKSLDGVENSVALKTLRIDNNQLEAFPSNILSLTDLQVLSMTGNNFPAQPVPPGLAGFTNLVFFSCSGCRFSGTFPTWLGTWQKIQFLDLSQNAFVDQLPTSLQSLPNLKHLDLSDQFSFGGRLSGPLLSFSSQTMLSELLLHHNDISGDVPEDLLAGRTATDKVTIDLRSNRLEGTLPSSLSRFAGGKLLFSMNRITEIADELCTADLNDGNVAAHQCDGLLCKNGTFNAFGRAIGDLGCIKCEVDTGGFFPIDFLGSTTCGSGRERHLLRIFFGELDGPNWKDNTNWVSSDDHCTWAGIECHENGINKGLVKSIDLADNNLNGATSAPIITFQGLTSLNLRENDMDISLNGIANAINLETLVISQTSVSSIKSLRFSQSLRSLHATSIGLSGPFPEELSMMTNLEELYLNYNDFSGTLPTTIGNMKSLTDLYLFGNKIDGQLPTELGNLESLENLSLGNNTIYGTIPPQLMTLPNLKVLSLQNEKGTDPDDSFSTRKGLIGNVPAFDGLRKIQEIYIGSNSLEGQIPSNFLASADKSSKIKVDLSYNQIGGGIPSSLAMFDDLQLFAEGNQISDVPDEICSKSKWMNGEVSRTCDAILCQPGTYNEFGRQMSSRTTCHDCPYSSAVQYFGSTSCGPSTAGETLDDRSILFKLFDATNGAKWTNSNKWKSDSDSVCDWFGITCGSPNDKGDRPITEINLGENGLSGTVPSVVFRLPSLESLDLQGNDVVVKFRSVGLATSLRELTLNGTRVDNLSGIGKAKSLTKLNLQGNRFDWRSIPNELYDLTSLVELDLSNSKLSGELSSKISNLVRLQTLRLSGNNFNGQLPDEISNLLQLRSVYLSDNNFFGSIPSAVGDLNNLEDFEMDNSERTSVGVTGPLPSFAKASALRRLVLSSNQLTGSIPTDFLSGVSDKSETVIVQLDSNHLTGTLPSTLGNFARLNIDVTENLLVGIGEGLCDKTGWLGGNVGEYTCNGIMCPAGHYSPIGRQNSADTKCESCPEAASSPYFGSSSCASIQKTKQRNILKSLYEATGGKDWTKSNGWMDDSVDICKWEGISCVGEASVESILLGGNNLVGTPPKEIFELPDLKFLWLYSNPITFRFENIGRAKSLTSLLVDSTGLVSLDGIGEAVSLVDVDVRFNKISGPLPDEIGNLYNLESFSCSANQISGPVPSFLGNPKLNTLRMGSNKLDGNIPSFAIHTELKSIDLSDNNLEGQLPVNFLDSVGTSDPIYVDLSENMISGVVPKELARFDDLTLYLRGNRIEGVDAALCTQENWNGGDVGTHKCDGLLCPAGTYSPNGRASKGSETCELCNEATYFGSTTCGENIEDSSGVPALRQRSFSSLLIGTALVIVALSI